MKYLLGLPLLLCAVGCGEVKVGSDATAAVDASGSAVADAASITIDAAADTTDATPIPDAAPACTGALVGTACWYKGNTGESCTQVCDTHGGFDPATITFAGSASDGDRSNSANCSSVVAALSTLTYTDNVDNVNQSNDYGCVEEPGKSRAELVSVNATVEGSANTLLVRFCACNN